MGCTGSKAKVVPPTPINIAISPTPPPRTPSPPHRTPTPPPRTPSPAPDQVVIEVDKGKDEVDVTAGDEGYPTPKPPRAGEVDSGAATHWFASDWIEGGPNPVVDDDVLSLQSFTSDINLDGSDDADTYQPQPDVKPVLLPTISYTAVDSHAGRATDKDMASFDALVSYLREAIPGGSRFPERLLARAIVKWLSEQDVDGRSYGSANLDTPTGLLQYMREGRMTYATCYTILCRKAGLKCVVVRGAVKAAGYQAGDMDVHRTNWVAVHVDGSWQIVQPHWVCRVLCGHKLGGWTKVESDGKTMSKTEVAAEGVVRNAFQENFFMPRPSVFVYLCCADDPQWQLLPKDSIVPSPDAFMKLPYLLPTFFGLQLKLISEHKCVLHSENGVCIIKIQGNPDNAHRLNLLYDLYVKNTEQGDNPMIQEKNLPRLVLQSRSNDLFTFQVRFPIEGVFKLVIFGGPHGSSMMRLCEFKLVCEKRMAQCRLLPKQAGIEGWGPGPVAETNGLFLPTKQNGIVPVSLNSSPGQASRETFRFQLSQGQASKSRYSAELIQGSDFEGDIEIQKVQKTPLQCTVDTASSTLDISTSISKPGEYALVISRTDQTEGRTVACNYLLSSFIEPPRLKANQRIAKRNLAEILHSNLNARLDEKIVTLENGIEKCRKQKLAEDDDDVAVAITRLEFLKVKKGIEDCILRRHLGVTMRAMKHLMTYRYKSALSNDVTRLHNLMQELLTLHGYSMPMPSLRGAIKELHNMVNPKAEVRKIVRAFFLLLGYRDEEDDWPTFQTYLMPRPVMAHIDNLNLKELHPDRRHMAGRMVAGYDEERVRHVSQSAARILRWLTQAIKEAEEDTGASTS